MREDDYLYEKHLQTDAEEPEFYSVYADDGTHRYLTMCTMNKSLAENHAAQLRANLCDDFKVEVIRE